MDKIRESIDSIRLDDENKCRILKRIKENKGKVNSMKINKLVVVGVVALVIVAGGSLIKFNSNKPLGGGGASSPPIGQEYVPEKEFNNFNVQNLKKMNLKLEIRNHVNESTIKEIDNKDFISKVLSYIEQSKHINLTDKEYEAIAKSQAEGKSFTLRFVDPSGNFYSVRVNLDINLVCLNEEYKEVNKEMINIIVGNLGNIDNIYKENMPLPQ